MAGGLKTTSFRGENSAGRVFQNVENLLNELDGARLIYHNKNGN